jgi:uncharacterized protein YebE (UPF0316 family)
VKVFNLAKNDIMLEHLSLFYHSELFDTFLVPVLIFCARICDVTIGTFRIVMVSKGNKYLAPVLGFFEVTIWIIAIGKIMQNVDNWVNIVAYSGGFATGNFIGLLIEERVAMGIVKIQIITAKTADELIDMLRKSGYGVTNHDAFGGTGKVSIIYTIIKRADIPRVIELIKTYNPNAFYSIEDVKFVNKNVGTIYPLRRFERNGK